MEFWQKSFRFGLIVANFKSVLFHLVLVINYFSLGNFFDEFASLHSSFYFFSLGSYLEGVRAVDEGGQHRRLSAPGVADDEDGIVDLMTFDLGECKF